MDAVLDELLATSENGGHVYVGERFGVGVRFFCFLSFFTEAVERRRRRKTKNSPTFFSASLFLKTKKTQGAFNKRMEHLTCFIAGNLALGVMHGAIADPKKVRESVPYFLLVFFFFRRRKSRERKSRVREKKTHSSLPFFPPTPTKNNKTGRTLHGRGQGDHGDVLQHVQADAER